MNFKAKLARLEKLAGKDSCPSCRLFWRSRQLEHARAMAATDRTLVVSSPCDLCGRLSLVDLSPCPEHMREMYRLDCTSTLEDKFTDPRAWVAREGLINWFQLKHARRRHKAEAEDTPTADSKPERAGRAWTTPADYKRYAKLRADYDEAVALKRRHLAAKYGENPFSDLQVRISRAKCKGFGHLYPGDPFAVDIDQLLRIYDEVTILLRCAEVDKIVHGDVTSFTAAQLAECEQRALDVIEAGRREHEEATWPWRGEEERAQEGQQASERVPPAEELAVPPSKAPALPDRKLPARMTAEDNPGTIAHSQSVSRPTAPANYGFDYRPQLRSPQTVDPSQLWVTGRRRRPR